MHIGRAGDGYGGESDDVDERTMFNHRIVAENAYVMRPLQEMAGASDVGTRRPYRVSDNPGGIHASFLPSLSFLPARPQATSPGREHPTFPRDLLS